MIIFCIVLIISLCIYIGVYPSLSIHLENKNGKTKEQRFDISRHIINTISFWIPFIITFCLIFFLIKDFRAMPIIGITLSLTAALFTGLIGTLIGHRINIKNADILEVNPDLKQVKEEKAKFTIGVIHSTKGTVSTIKHTKDAVNDIINVDGWKEMN